MIAWLFAVWATWASAGCDGLSEADLADRIHASLDAIHRADIEGHSAIILDLEARLPCLEFVPSPERWAELLVGIAIVEHARGGDWEAPLTTALRVHPKVHLLVGPSHEFRSWTPPARPTEPGRVVPAGVRIYLDGELTSEVRTDGALHLAQRRTGDGWSTLLLQGEPLPDEWFAEPPLLSRRGLRYGGSGGVRAGGGVFAQRVDPLGDTVAEADRAGLAVGFDASGYLGPGGLPGLYLDLTWPGLADASAARFHGGLDVPLGPVGLQAGAGASNIVAQDVAGRVAAPVFLPVGGLRVALGDRPSLDASVRIGGTRAVQVQDADVGVALGASRVRPRLSTFFDRTSGAWEQSGLDRSIRATSVYFGVALGGTLGPGGEP